MDSFRRWSNKITVSANSIRFSRVPSYHPNKGDISKRGNICCFSRHSRLRLRDAIAQAAVSSSTAWGLCLTLPWVCSFDDSSLELLCIKYRECWNRFTLSFRRSLPNSAAIFRHELQRRKVPHTHLILFLSKVDRDNINEPIERLIFNIWFASLFFRLDSAGIDFARHGIKLDKLDNADAMYRYIADHTSKSKQAQLGYKGKQWGYINRKVICTHPSIDYHLPTQKSIYDFQRHIAKVCRFRVNAACVFGKKLSSSRFGVSLCYVRYTTTKKLLAYLRREYGQISRSSHSYRSDMAWRDFNSEYRDLDLMRRVYKYENSVLRPDDLFDTMSLDDVAFLSSQLKKYVGKR